MTHLTIGGTDAMEKMTTNWLHTSNLCSYLCTSYVLCICMLRCSSNLQCNQWVSLFCHFIQCPLHLNNSPSQSYNPNHHVLFLFENISNYKSWSLLQASQWCCAKHFSFAQCNQWKQFSIAPHVAPFIWFILLLNLIIQTTTPTSHLSTFLITYLGAYCRCRHPNICIVLCKQHLPLAIDFLLHLRRHWSDPFGVSFTLCPHIHGSKPFGVSFSACFTLCLSRHWSYCFTHALNLKQCTHLSGGETVNSSGLFCFAIIVFELIM